MPKDVVVVGPPGTGKCVIPETYALTQAGMVEIGSLVNELPGEDRTVPLQNVYVQGLDGSRQATGFYDGGLKGVIKLTTVKGFEVTGSFNHPVMTLKNGERAWVLLKDLRPGDRVAIAVGSELFPTEHPSLPESCSSFVARYGYLQDYRVKITTPKIMSDDLADWLGWFISEACFGDRGKSVPIIFCNFSNAVVEHVESITKKLFGIGFKKYREHNFNISNNRLKEWLKKLGANGLAADKSVPDVILRSPRLCQKAYLRASFEAEGSISTKQRSIEFSTASEKLGLQIQLMLLNFGVVSTRTFRSIFTDRWGLRKYWRVSIFGDQVLKFRSTVGFMAGSEKQFKLGSVNKSPVGWNTLGLPVEFIKKRYAGIRKTMKESFDERPRNFWRKATRVVRSFSGTRNDSVQALVSRSLVNRGLELFSDYSLSEPYKEIKEELESSRLWDEVVDVEFVGKRHVVDICVPDGNSFVGNGIVCHNTESMMTVAHDWFRRRKAGPTEVAYLAFTRAAAKEAAERTLDDNLKKDVGDRLPFFRTLHSLAYRGLLQEYPDARLVTTADMKLFAKSTGLDGVYAVHEWEDLSELYRQLENHGRTDWDKCLTAYTLSRISSRSADEMERAKVEMSPLACRTIGFMEESVYKVFVNKYEDFKKQNGLIDFTDMLRFAFTEMKPLDNVKFVVIDEAQDMAHLLVNIVDRLFRNAQEIWWAGDANQAIYGFAAADARIFIERARKASTRIVLRQTHRFGQEIVDLSTKIIKRAHDRMDVDVIGLEGKIHNVHSTGEFRPVVGQALILHRHVLGCQAVAASYIAAGLPFRNERGRDPLGANVRVRAFKAMRDLAGGGDISMGAVHRLVDDLMPSILIGEDGLKKRLVVHGAKKKLQDAQNEGAVRLVDLVRSGILTQDGADIIRMKSYRLFRHADDLAYYDRVIENGYDLEGNCPIITTMHGSKGRQAEQVIVFNEMGRKCWDDPDTEHRLAYVAATRTRGELEICNERTLDWAEMPYEYPVNNV